MNTLSTNKRTMNISFLEQRNIFNTSESFSFDVTTQGSQTTAESLNDPMFTEASSEVNNLNSEFFDQRKSLQNKISQPTEQELRTWEQSAEKNGAGAIKKLADLFNANPSDYVQYREYAQKLAQNTSPSRNQPVLTTPVTKETTSSASNIPLFASLEASLSESAGTQKIAAKHYSQEFTQWIAKNPNAYVSDDVKRILNIQPKQKPRKPVPGVKLTTEEITALTLKVKALKSDQLGNYILKAQNDEGDFLRLLEEEAIQRITGKPISMNARISQNERNALSQSGIPYGKEDAAEYYENLVEALNTEQEKEILEEETTFTYEVLQNLTIEGGTKTFSTLLKNEKIDVPQAQYEPTERNFSFTFEGEENIAIMYFILPEKYKDLTLEEVLDVIPNDKKSQ